VAQITVGDLHQLAANALIGQGFPMELAAEVTEEFVEAELAGTRTHGVGKIPSMNLGDPQASPDITVAGSVIRVDGQRVSGLLLLRRVAEVCAPVALEHGVALASIRNFSRYSSLYPYTEMLAVGGLVGILMNSAGPAAVAPFGGVEPVTGTNPICFSFPAGDGVQTLDFATSEVVWGEIRQAALEGRGVTYGAFLDASGEVTTVPNEVNAVKAFGGVKGWVLNLAIEVVGGLLTGSRAGLEVHDEFDCGAVLIAIDPGATGASKDFPALVGVLLQQVRDSRPLDGSVPVRAPGDRGRSSIELDRRGSEMVDVPESTISLLQRMAKGERIAELSSNPLFN
jgi:LDH2 family malate/lactate/ureidoglycolate dehydrogenase